MGHIIVSIRRSFFSLALIVCSYSSWGRVELVLGQLVSSSRDAEAWQQKTPET